MNLFQRKIFKTQNSLTNVTLMGRKRREIQNRQFVKIQSYMSNFFSINFVFVFKISTHTDSRLSQNYHFEFCKIKTFNPFANHFFFPPALPFMKIWQKLRKYHTKGTNLFCKTKQTKNNF